jgi:hypothetical protein
MDLGSSIDVVMQGNNLSMTSIFFTNRHDFVKVVEEVRKTEQTLEIVIMENVTEN